MVRLIAIIALVVLVILVIKKLGQAGSLFTLLVLKNDVQLKGEIPGWRASDVREFIRSLNLPVGATIKGVKDGDRFRLVFSNQLDGDTCQRIRNFLYLKV